MGNIQIISKVNEEHARSRVCVCVCVCVYVYVDMKCS
jgi:hypothetical protein